MNLTVLGTGSFGRAMGNLFSAKGVPVVYGSRDPHVASLKLTGTTILSFQDAIAASSMVVLAIPAGSVLEVLSSCGPLDGVTLVDAINPVNSDWSPMSLGKYFSVAEMLQATFPAAFVVKAFNNIFADALRRVAADSRLERPTVFVAGSHSESKSRVLHLIDQIEFPAVDVGGLENSRYLEAMAHLNIQLALPMGRGTTGAFRYS